MSETLVDLQLTSNEVWQIEQICDEFEGDAIPNCTLNCFFGFPPRTRGNQLTKNVTARRKRSQALDGMKRSLLFTGMSAK